MDVSIAVVLFLVCCATTLVMLISFAMDLTSKTEKIITAIWCTSIVLFDIAALLGVALEWINT